VSSQPGVPIAIPEAAITRIAVVIPCYRVTRHIAGVIGAIGPECWRIYVVDDACPDGSGDFVTANARDARIRVLRNATNQGVGGAVMAGYRAAIADGATVIVKIDGDGQMDPRLLRHFVAPILSGEADYTKGNRFYDFANVARMPRIRIFGNAALSIFAKLSTGYWGVFDPTNGYTAIHARLAQHLPLEKISKRYFFETDVLFRLNTLRAVVVDVPMDAIYGDETSNLPIARVMPEFFAKHARNLLRRLFYNYFLRDVSIASIELVLGTLLLAFGLTFGAYHWIKSAEAGIATPVGTIMLSALSVLAGLQFVMSFVNYDIASVPKRAIHDLLPERSMGDPQ
jgi:glycosyltransferase involved in cell wall biosynthesis